MSNLLNVIWTRRDVSEPVAGNQEPYLNAALSPASLQRQPFRQGSNSCYDVVQYSSTPASSALHVSLAHNQPFVHGNQLFPPEVMPGQQVVLREEPDRLLGLPECNSLDGTSSTSSLATQGEERDAAVMLLKKNEQQEPAPSTERQQKHLLFKTESEKDEPPPKRRGRKPGSTAKAKKLREESPPPRKRRRRKSSDSGLVVKVKEAREDDAEAWFDEQPEQKKSVDGAEQHMKKKSVQKKAVFRHSEGTEPTSPSLTKRKKSSDTEINPRRSNRSAAHDASAKIISQTQSLRRVADEDGNGNAAIKEDEDNTNSSTGSRSSTPESNDQSPAVPRRRGKKRAAGSTKGHYETLTETLMDEAKPEAIVKGKSQTVRGFDLVRRRSKKSPASAVARPTTESFREQGFAKNGRKLATADEKRVKGERQWAQGSDETLPDASRSRPRRSAARDADLKILSINQGDHYMSHDEDEYSNALSDKDQKEKSRPGAKRKRESGIEITSSRVHAGDSSGNLDVHDRDAISSGPIDHKDNTKFQKAVSDARRKRGKAKKDRVPENSVELDLLNQANKRVAKPTTQDDPSSKKRVQDNVLSGEQRRPRGMNRTVASASDDDSEEKEWQDELSEGSASAQHGNPSVSIDREKEGHVVNIKDVAFKSNSIDKMGGDTFEVRDTDVGFKTCSGYTLYRELIKIKAPNYMKDKKAAVTQVIEAIGSQSPPGRFLSLDCQHILDGKQTYDKVRTALKRAYNALPTSAHKTESNGKGDRRMSESIEGEDDDTRPRPTDVLGGLKKFGDISIFKNPGNILYLDLVKQHCNLADVSAAVDLIIKSIRSQNPPGRFFSPDNNAILNESAARKKIIACVHQTKGRNGSQGEACATTLPTQKTLKRNPESTDATEEDDQSVIRGTDTHIGKQVPPEVKADIHLPSQDEPPSSRDEEERAQAKALPGEDESEIEEEGHDAVLDSEEPSETSVKKASKKSQVRITDVLAGTHPDAKEHAGTRLFVDLTHQLVNEDLDVATNKVLNAIRGQDPPGRFWNTNGTLMNEKQMLFKIRRTFGDRRRTLNGRKPTQSKPKISKLDVLPSDVLWDTTASSSRAPEGTKLFLELVAKHAAQFDTPEQTRVIDEIIRAIKEQTPEGRFLASDGETCLDTPQSRNRIWIALSKYNSQNSHSQKEVRPLTVPATMMLDESSSISLDQNQNDLSVKEPVVSDDERVSTMVQSALVEDGRVDDRQSLLALASHVSDDDESDTKVQQSVQRSTTPDGVQPSAGDGVYVEDIAWRKFSGVGSADNVPALPPLDPMPLAPEDTEDRSCIWTCDEDSRVIRGQLKHGFQDLSKDDEDFVTRMMERDDIAIITGGHCKGLNSALWTLDFLEKYGGDNYHHQFRLFTKTENTVNQDDYEETGKDLSMKICDFVAYLRRRMEVLDLSESDGDAAASKRLFAFIDFQGKEKMLDVLKDVVYMLDFDVKRRLPSIYADFKKNFALRESLPGGNLCIMNPVNEAARPDMGPNLYISPPGGFTRWHRDGDGTVDSGHLALTGFNEVVILRRLPLMHERRAINFNGNTLYDLPHADGQDARTTEWPSKARIKRLNTQNYAAIVLVLGPGELLHIGKGRFHTFRKLGPEKLPEDDCHFDLRNEVHKYLKEKKFPARRLMNMSLAWDWSYRGVTPEGINREMVSTLENAFRNRRFERPKQSLAIPKLCLLSSIETALASTGSANESMFGMETQPNLDWQKRNYDIVKGLLPSLEFVFSQENAMHPDADKGNERNFPNSCENPATFPLDAYGNGDYFCKICSQELPNAYMHCNGCEELLTRDLNVCCECHSKRKHTIFLLINGRSNKRDSSLNHICFHDTSNGRKRGSIGCSCVERKLCIKCKRCCYCDCTCHESFTLNRRLWKPERLLELVEAARALVGNDKVPFYDEVAPRLREAQKVILT